ncbi:MAG: hypothetical protein R2730_04725 [Chitinophagales bacterium]
MATQSFLSGYIMSKKEYNDYNSSLISECSHKTVPFKRIINDPIDVFGGSIFSLAYVFKANEIEWIDWIQEFELLILKLKALTIKIYIESSDEKRHMVFEYVNISVGANDIGFKWKRFISDLNDTINNEQIKQG